MIASDVITYAQTLLGEGNTGQRFSTSQYVQAIDRAQKLLVRDLKWPPSRFVFNTIIGVQEYQLREVIKILAVYLNGQPLIRTDKNILEGRYLDQYDQSGTGGGPGGLVMQNQAPVLVGSTYTPAWTSEPSAAYPVPSGIGIGFPVNTPWFSGSRPRYYCNGGNIGFVPIPSGAYTIVCEVVQQPVTLQNDTDDLVLPDIALDAIAWKVAETFMFSDSQIGADRRNYAISQYNSAKAELRSWVRGYDGGAARGPKPLTYRSFYVKGNNRMGGD